MKDIKDSIKLMRFNRRNVLLFEGILLIVSYAIFMPVLNLSKKTYSDTLSHLPHISFFWWLS